LESKYEEDWKGRFTRKEYIYFYILKRKFEKIHLKLTYVGEWFRVVLQVVFTSKGRIFYVSHYMGGVIVTCALI